MEYLLNFSKIDVKYLDQLYTNIIKETKKSIDQIANLDINHLSYSTCFGNNLYLENQLETSTYILKLEYLHPKEQIRAKIKQINKLLKEYKFLQLRRQDIYEKIMIYYYGQFNYEELTDEQRSHVEKTIEEYRYMGIHMGNTTFDKELQIINLGQKYIDNISSNQIKVKLTDLELDGCNESIKSHGSDIFITRSIFSHIMKYCSNQNTRKKVYLEYFKEHNSNSTQLEQIIRCRNELANIFGFQSYSDLILNRTMAKTKNSVRNFLAELFEKYNPICSVNELVEFASTNLELWDIMYLTNKIKIIKSGFKLEQLEEMIDYKSVLDGIFKIYKDIFQVDIIEISDESLKYDKDVKVYLASMYNKPIGYFYLDMFYKSFKIPGARVGNLVFKSKQNLPIGILVCNFRQQMFFDNVTTLLHEFGHMLHYLVSKREIYINSMYNVPTDYVEIPSKFFELWAYNVYGLGCLVKPKHRHLITEEFVNKLILYRDTLYPLEYSEYLIKSFVDFELHTNKNADAKLILKDLNKKFYKITNTPEQLSPLATWPHLVGNYASKFYSYLWSNEYAIKIYEKFKTAKNIKLVGRHFVQMLLEPGSMMDYQDNLKKFLELKY